MDRKPTQVELATQKYYDKEDRRWQILLQCKQPRQRDVKKYVDEALMAYGLKVRYAFNKPAITFSNEADGMSYASYDFVVIHKKFNWLVVCHELAHSLYMQQTSDLSVRGQHRSKHRKITDWLCNFLIKKGYLDENFVV